MDQEPVDPGRTERAPSSTGDTPTVAFSAAATQVEQATVSPGAPGQETVVVRAGGSQADAARTLAATVPGYDILGELGRGGMGVVYKARHLGLDRMVALKMILSGAHAGLDDLDRFRTEAQAVAQLQHPNIVQIYEIGEHDGRPFFSLEYLGGGSLDGKLKGTPMPSRDAARVVETLARAIDAAHRHQIIHRDLKPANVLLAEDGSPKITDFGLAKRLDDDHGRTQSGAIMGTPSYMAPEQARGDSGTIGPAADIYALGAVLYELLTGRPPFRAATPLETVMQVVSQDPVPPGRLQPGLPIDIETICMKCLQKAPAARYDAAAALADDLQRFTEDRPILARRSTVAERLVRWTRHHKAIAASLAAITTLLVAGVIGLAIATALFRTQANLQARLARENEAARIRADRARLRADQAQQATGVALLQAETALTDMQAANGLMAGQRGDAAQAVLWYSSAARLARKDPIRSAANLASARLWSHEAAPFVAALPTRGKPIRLLEFQPLDGHLLTLDTAGHCSVWDWRREQAVPWMKGESAVSAACWSADGAWLALGRPSGQVEIRALPSGTTQHQLEVGEAVTALGFDPGGAWLAIGGAALRFWDCRKGALARGSWPHPEPIHALKFNSRGDRLATASANQTVYVFAIPRGSGSVRPLFGPLPHLSERSDRIPPPAFISAGRALLTITGKRELTAWDADTGQPTDAGPIATELDPLFEVVASHDGSIFVADRSLKVPFGPQLWTVRDGVTTSRRLEHRNYVTSLSISRDDSVLLTASWDGTAKLWSLPSGTLQGNPLIHQGNVELAAISPGGLFVATAQSDGLVRVWGRPAGRRSDRTIPGSNVAVLSSDGRRVVASQFSFNSVGRGDRTLRVYDVSTGRPAGPSLALRGPLRVTSLSPKASLVAVGYEEENFGRLALFDFATGKPRFEPLALPGTPEAIEFSPDGSTVATYCLGGSVILIDPDRGNEIFRFPYNDRGSRILPARRRVAFTPDGSCLAVLGGDKRVQVWDLAQRGAILPQPAAQHVSDLALSHDGRFLATVTFSFNAADNALHVWDLRSGRDVVPAMRHPDGIFGVGFSPDDRQIMTAGRDGQARLWDWRTGRLACPPMENEDEVYEAAFTPDGRWGLAACRDGMVRIWDLHLGTRVGPPISVVANQGGSALAVAVTPDGRRALVGSTAANFHVIDLADLAANESRGAEELGALAELTAGYRVDSGNLSKLTEAEWIARWRGVRASSPESAGEGLAMASASAPERLPREDRDSRLERATFSADRGNWTQAAAAFAELVRDAPRDLSLLRKIGEVQARHARWEDAASSYKQILKLGSKNQDDAFRYAALLLEARDVEAFRRHRRWILDQFGRIGEVATARRLSKACLIAPLPGPDQDQALRWASVSADESIRLKSLLPSAYLNKCLAEYRAGHHDEAITWADRIIQETSATWAYKLPARLVRAMVQSRRGHHDESRRELDQVRESERIRLPKVGSSDFGQTWVDRLFVNSLIREAERELVGASGTDEPQGRPD